MGYFGNNKGEENADEVVKLLLEGKEINQKQRDTFFRANYWDIMKTSADILGIPYTDEPIAVSGQKPTLAAATPDITTAMIRKAPRFFDSVVGVGIPVEVFGYRHSRPNDVTNETMSPEEKMKLVRVKESFNRRLDNFIPYANKFFQSSADMDILSNADNLEANQRDIYQGIGSSRLGVLEYAVKNNNADANVFLKVTTPEGNEYALEPAIKLLNIGVKVWDWDGGEKCGAFETVEALPDYRQKLQSLLNGLDLKRASEDTGIDKKTLERLGRGDVEVKTSYKDLESLQNYLKQQTDETKYGQISLIKEQPVVFTISRVFARGEKPQATKPQIHTMFSGVILPGWQNAYDSWENHFATKKAPEREVTKDSPILKRFAY